MQFSPYALLVAALLAAIAYCIFDAYRFIKRYPAEPSHLSIIKQAKNVPGAGEAIIALILIFFALLFFGLSLVVTDQSRFFLHELKFVPFSFLPAALLAAYLKMLGKIRLMPAGLLALLLIIPAITVVLVLTNDYHHAFRLGMDVITNNGISYVWPVSSWWYPIQYSYFYIVYILGFFIILADYYGKPAIYRGHMTVIVLSNFFLMFISLLSLTGLINDYGDMALLAHALTVMAQSRVVIKHSTRPAVRKARSLTVAESNNPVIIFDHKDKLLDANRSAINIISPLLPGFSPTHDIDYETLGRKLTGNPDELDGSEIYLDYNKSHYTATSKTLYDDGSRRIGRLVVLNDVTLLRGALSELEYITTHDYLTGLLNRRAFRHSLRGLKPPELPAAVVFANISGMKLINDIFGEDHGDVIIKNAADILRECGKKFSSTGATRLSGNEFAIILKNADESDANSFIQTFKDEIAEKCSDKYRVSLTVAISVTKSENINWQAINAAIESLHNTKQSGGQSSIEGLKQAFDTNHNIKAKRISDISCRIGKQMDLNETDLLRLDMLAYFKDIGLLSVPSELIKHKGNLSNEQWEEYKLHAIKGYNIALSVPGISSIAPEIRAHHERYDGYGYPDRLKADNIPLLARITALAEAISEFEEPADALDALKKFPGKRYDPILFDLCTKIYNVELANEN